MKFFFTIFSFLFLTPLFSQYTIYKDASTVITGTWASASGGGAATLTEVDANEPYEGSQHYQFDYNYTEWWAGTGLNFDEWGNAAPLDLSGYTHLRIAYRGLSGGGESMAIQLAGTNGELSNEVVVGSQVSNYNVVDVPIIGLISGTNVSMNQITGIQFNMNGSFESAGTLYFDAIELVNIGNDASAASAATWARAASVSRGVNTANWLEAHWFIEFDAFPETNKYNANNIQALVDAGFDVIRMPVTFERFTPQSPPYTIPMDHAAIQLIDDMIDWAVQYDFKLIIDNHHGYEITNENFETELPRLVAIWEQLATRYGDLDPDRYFFEVYNEAHAISNTNLRPFYTEIIAAIRERETQTHSILIGATGYNSGNDLISFTPLADEDIIYTFHNYDPYFFTHQGMTWTTPPNLPVVTFPQADEVNQINNLFASVADWSANWDVPVWLGEYGVSTAADATSRCNWIETLENAARTNNIVAFYWDSISDTDAFGFFNGGVVSESTTIPCFAAAMNLFEAPLAVEDVDFSVDCATQEIILALGQKVNIQHTLQSSTDGLTWKKEADFIKVDNQHWSRFAARKFAAYYRVQSIEADGQISYSSIVNVPCAGENLAWTLSPNPTQQTFQINMPQSNSSFDVALYDFTGRLVQQWQARRSGQALDLKVLPTGVYVVKVHQADGRFSLRRLVVR